MLGELKLSNRIPIWYLIERHSVVSLPENMILWLKKVAVFKNFQHYLLSMSKRVDQKIISLWF